MIQPKTRDLVATCFLFLAFISVSGLAADRPNIVVIMVDDMGFSDIASYGSEIPTPHLDALAANGVQFSQFYNTGRCCPTRASLLTGLYSHRAGIGWMTSDQGTSGYQGRLNQNCVTMAEVLRDAGYFTAMTGKWHVGFDDDVNPRSRGFDRSLNLAAGGIHFSNQTGSKGSAKLYLDGEEIERDDPRTSPPWYGTDLWTRQGLAFADEAIAKDQPFFWYLAHTAPHFPCMAPEETIAKYRGKYLAGWDELRRQRHARQIESGLIDPTWDLTPRPDQIPAWDSLSQEQQKRYDDMMAIYAAMIDEIDQSVGQLVDGLRQRGQLENTLILFFSDNGGNAEAGVKGRYEGDHPGDPHSNVFIGQCWAHLNNTPFRKYKHFNHEGGTATPLIAHWPRRVQPRNGRVQPRNGRVQPRNGRVQPSDSWVTTPAHIVDVMATCVDVAGATYPTSFQNHEIKKLDGQSLVPLLTGTGEFAPRPLFWEHEGNAAMRIGDDKLVRAGQNGEWELFNLRADRTEQHDRSDQVPDVLDSMVDRWTAWARANDVLPKPKKKPKNRKAKQAKKAG